MQELLRNFSTAEIEVHPSGGGVPVKRAGPVLSILRKQADGRWVIVRDANMLAVAAE